MPAVIPPRPFRISFSGRVYPSGLHLNIKIPFVDFRYDQPEPFDARFRISIVESAINVSCEFSVLFPDYLYPLWHKAQEFAAAAVNVGAFQMGVGAITVLDHWTDMLGKTSPLALAGANLAGLCTVVDQDPDSGKFDEVFKLVFFEPALLIALNDLILSNINPHHILINCHRCVEAIRTMIAGPGRGAKAWEAMHVALNVDRAYLQFINDRARDPRHGNQVHVPNDETNEARVRAWKIMDRFLHYRLAGNQPLLPSLFPLLKG